MVRPKSVVRPWALAEPTAVVPVASSRSALPCLCRSRRRVIRGCNVLSRHARMEVSPDPSNISCHSPLAPTDPPATAYPTREAALTPEAGKSSRTPLAQGRAAGRHVTCGRALAELAAGNVGWGGRFERRVERLARVAGCPLRRVSSIQCVHSQTHKRCTTSRLPARPVLGNAPVAAHQS